MFILLQWWNYCGTLHMCQRLNTGESKNFYFGIFICSGPLIMKNEFQNVIFLKYVITPEWPDAYLVPNLIPVRKFIVGRPISAEVLTRVMRLGLESDSSHYFCDLWLDLDLQRNDLRLDLDLQRNDLRLDLNLQRNDLLPTQVKSYSSDPGTS